MKKILFATLALAVMFTSCSKEDNGAQSQDNILVINLPDNVGLRAVEGQASTTTTITLSNVTVFLLNGNTVAQTPETFDASEIALKFKRIDDVSSGVNKVIVVANIPATDRKSTRLNSSH